jgi:uncharacterized membrane protein (UPF0127 family)
MDKEKLKTLREEVKKGDMRLIFFILFFIPHLGLTGTAGHACPFDLPTTTIVIKGHKLTVEWAVTPEERSCGLSNRFSLDENKGMLFVYKSTRPLSFWMKDTHVLLSIAFLDKDGRIINIETMTPNQTQIKYRSVRPALYALETNRGWFQSHGIGIGDRVNIKPQKSQ